MEQTLESIASYVQGNVIGNGKLLIHGVNTLDLVRSGQICFAESPRRIKQALESSASAVIVPSGAEELNGKSGVSVSNPKLAFALVMKLFNQLKLPPSGVHASAVIGNGVVFGEDICIRPHAVVGDGVSIGRGTIVESCSVIGDGVTIGEESLIGPNVTIYHDCQLGNRVHVHAGTVIGGDGFGYVFHQGEHVKVPQIGNVVIEDDVEIGCNVCVDRATFGSTLIRKGTKIDNLVQIAHNNMIGRHVVITGKGGLCGSVTVGDYSVLGGQTVVKDHVTIGEGSRMGLCSVVTKSIPPGSTVWGYPARPIRETKRVMAHLGRLPSLSERLRSLELSMKPLHQKNIDGESFSSV